MTKTQIVIPESGVNDDMLERVALQQVRLFTESSAHAPFLEGMREKGHVSTVVNNPVTDEIIDIRTYGGRRARHREQDNRLERDGASKHLKPPSLFPIGGNKLSTTEKRKRDGEEYFSAGVNASIHKSTEVVGAADGLDLTDGLVIPQRCINLSFDTEHVTTDSMMHRFSRRDFCISDVVQEALNVDSGETEIVEKRREKSLYLRM